jgi:hypothetical protein
MRIMVYIILRFKSFENFYQSLIPKINPNQSISISFFLDTPEYSSNKVIRFSCVYIPSKITPNSFVSIYPAIIPSSFIIIK